MSSSEIKNSNRLVSCQTFHIAGILTDVYGLDELSPQFTSISCLWLLHPRLQAREWNTKVADNAIKKWNGRPQNERKVGLIATSFDLRNHGSRMASSKANDTWKEGNEVNTIDGSISSTDGVPQTHAQDMYRYVKL